MLGVELDLPFNERLDGHLRSLIPLLFRFGFLAVLPFDALSLTSLTILRLDTQLLGEVTRQGEYHRHAEILLALGKRRFRVVRCPRGLTYELLYFLLERLHVVDMLGIDDGDSRRLVRIVRMEFDLQFERGYEADRSTLDVTKERTTDLEGRRHRWQWV